MLFTPLLLKHFLPELRESLLRCKVIALRHQPDQKELLVVLKGSPKVSGLLVNYDSKNYHLLTLTDSQIRKLDYPRADNLLAELLDCTLEEIQQIDFDRILKFDLYKFDQLWGSRKLYLYCEISANLNLVLTDNQEQILDSLKSSPLDSTSPRPIRAGLKYRLSHPPAKSDPHQVTEVEWKSLLKKASGTIRGFLTFHFLGIDKFLAEEILYLSRVSPNSSISSLTESDSGKLHHHLLHFFSESVRLKPTLLLDQGQFPLFVSPFDLRHISESKKCYFDNLNQTLSHFYQLKNIQDQVGEQKKELLNLLEKRTAKIQDAVQLTEGQIKEKSKYQEYKNIADLLMINKNSIKKGVTNEVLQNLFSPQAERLKVSLNPRLSPLQNAQSYYRKYQRAKAGLALLENRKKLLQQHLIKLGALHDSVTACHSLSELDKVRVQLVKLGLHKPPVKTKARKKKPEKKQFRQFQIQEGWTVLVGRNNLENDLLTFKTAQPEDLWFHAAGLPGSHVVLRREQKKSQPSINAILETAGIAAYFSKGRNSKKLEVIYTQAKYVRKPQKAKPGLALVEKEKSVLVTPRLPETFEHSLKLTF